MGNATDYFARMAREEKKLRRHNLDHVPDCMELAYRVLDHEEALSALCSHMGVLLRKDARGRWIVVRKEAG